MKKIFVILSVFAAVIGCQKAEMDQPNETEGVKVPLKVTADIVQTKTTMTNEDGVLKSAWKDGDKVFMQMCQDKVFNKKSLVYTVGVSGATVEFTTEDKIELPAENMLNRYYVYGEYPKALGGNYGNMRSFSMSRTQVQAAPGDLAHIEAANMLYALPVVPEWGDEYAVVDLTFQHALSVLQLDLKGSEAGIKIVNLSVEMLDESGEDFLVITKGEFNYQQGGVIKQIEGENEFTLVLASAVELPVDDYASFYMTISPGHAGQTFKVTATTDMGKDIEVGTMKVPASGAIPQGAKAYKAFTVQPPVEEDVDWASAIDLSAAGTANTYLVTAANTLYKFRADVKGNGFVPAALTNEGVGQTVSIDPKSALILWYNCLQTSKAWVDMNPIELSSLTLKDGYIYFKTPETFVNGNVVIAAFAESGLSYSNITVDENRLMDNATILWSWNIWASEGYDLEEDAFTAGDFTIMGRNIGGIVGKSDIDACATAAERKYVAAAAIGNTYQWGNKNPYPSVSDYENYEVPTYGNQLLMTPTYTPILALQLGMNGQKSMLSQMFGTAADAILDLGTYLADADRVPAKIVAMTESAPYKYMKNSTSSYQYSWTGNIGNTCLINLWGDATLEDVSDHVKTIYDPCPAGWKVWEDDAWDAMAAAGAETAKIDFNAMDDNGNGNRGYGSIICGSYFPSSGTARGSGDMKINQLKRCGNTTNTEYVVSNPAIYDPNNWSGLKYLVEHKANFTVETDITMSIVKHLATGSATPLRCVKE